MKALLYCTEGGKKIYDENGELINGTIACTCEIEVERIENHKCGEVDMYATNTLGTYYLEKQSCLTYEQLRDYLVGKDGYAIHLKSVDTKNIPDPTVLRNSKFQMNVPIPQNMCKVYWITPALETIPYVLISVRPQWIEKILSGEKTIEVRKKVLKEMDRKMNKLEDYALPLLTVVNMELEKASFAPKWYQDKEKPFLDQLREAQGILNEIIKEKRK